MHQYNPKALKICINNMNPCVLIIFSLLLLNLDTKTANQLLAPEGERGRNGVISKCLDKERHSLLHFKSLLQDPNGCLSTWTADKHDCCIWKGVTCNNQTNHVIRLDIAGCHLIGEISPSLINLIYLDYLDLSRNLFHGTIPMFIGSMTRLRHLDLSTNQLNGIIPNSIGSLTKLRHLDFSLVNLTYLKHLDLSFNSFQGTIPTFIGSLTRLRHLHLGGNGFNGTIPWSVGSLTKLRHLALHSNNLNGTIPSSIGSLTHLRYLSLDDNNLNGMIPRSIGSLIALRFLDLSSNSLYGSIPPELGNLTNLQLLYLGGGGGCRVEKVEWLSHLSHLETLAMDGISLAKANHWVDVILSLRKLSYLSLRGCELSQVMCPYSSSSANSSSSIVDLYLGNNNLNSSMSRWLFPLTSNNLRELYLSSNMLDRIPKYLGNLCSLKVLNLNNNSAVVNFPDFLNNLTGCTSIALQHLDASHTQFTGPFPDKIHTLPNLTFLDMGSCNLGPHFPKWIQTLQNLYYLDISSNGISDTIPQDFRDMCPSQLRYMNLSSNNFTGKVPDLSSNFDNSSVIDLSLNNFYGPITNVPSTVASLNLSRNKFSGEISFLCQLARGILEFLDLSYNLLSGKLPDCLWNFKELKVLNLGHNNLSGRLPPSIGSLMGLEVLYLYHNNFSGELPLSLKNCSRLNSLILGANKFSGNVPVWIGDNLLRLYVLILRSNNFFGTIPLQLCQLENLQILDLSMNNLHGTIPSCLDHLTSMVQEGRLSMVQEEGFLPPQSVHYYSIEWYSSKGGLYDFLNGKYVDHAMIVWQGDEREFSSNLIFVKMIDLSSNNLTGQIPDELTNLHQLVALNLSENALHGEIPWNIGEMQKLLSVGLSRNNLSGRMPSSMSQMSLLNDLDVSFNNLSGRIPTSTQLQSFEPSRYEGNARLCGLPLTKKCLGDEVTQVPAVLGKREGDEEGKDDEDWGWYYIGGGTGFATGFWISFGVLILNRRGRHAFFQLYDCFRDWVYLKVVVFIANLYSVEHT